MPLINLEFDDVIVSKEEAWELSEAIQKIVSKATNIEDVFVYGNSAKIKVKIAPIEIFIRMTDHKIEDEKELINQVKLELSQWKKETNFPHPINLTLIPMKWNIEIGI